jgi:V8-like Glu-specific endopeptidase
MKQIEIQLFCWLCGRVFNYLDPGSNLSAGWFFKFKSEDYNGPENFYRAQKYYYQATKWSVNSIPF